MELRWSDYFEIGVGFIDDDHKHLMDIIGEAKNAIDNNNLQLCSMILMKLIVAAREHFQREEAYLEKIGYPGLEKHKVYHGELLARADITRQICEGINTAHDLQECFDGMVVFLVDDILVGDLGFKSYLEFNGLLDH